MSKFLYFYRWHIAVATLLLLSASLVVLGKINRIAMNPQTDKDFVILHLVEPADGATCVRKDQVASFSETRPYPKGAPAVKGTMITEINGTKHHVKESPVQVAHALGKLSLFDHEPQE